MTEEMKKLAETVVKEIIRIIDQGLKINHIDIRTKRVDSILELYLSRDNIINIPYKNWGNDFDNLPKRKMLVWSEYFAQLLIEKFDVDFLKKRLIYFSWNSKPVCTAYKEIINPHLDNTGEVLSETPVKAPESKGIGTVLFCTKSIVYISPETEVAIFNHKELRAAEINYSDSLSFTYHNVKYEYKTSSWHAEEINKGFNKEYLDKYLTDLYSLYNDKKYDRIIEQEDKIIQSKNPKDFFYLLNAYYLKNNYLDAIRVGKAGLAVDPVDIELLDALAPPMIKSGMFNELIYIFNNTKDAFTGVESLYVFNFTANMIVAYFAAGRFDEALKFTDRYYFGESNSASRIYYHNFACVFSRFEMNEKFLECIKCAIERGEDKERIMNESDFENLRNNKNLLNQVFEYIDQFKKLHDESDKCIVKKAVYGPGDLQIIINKYYDDPSGSYKLSDIAKLGEEKSVPFFKKLLENPYLDKISKAYSYIALIAFGTEESLNLAKEFYLKESEDLFMGLYIKYFESIIKDREKFKTDLINVFGYEGKILVDVYIEGKK